MTIQAGDCVIVFGLTSEAGKLCNGREGTVTQWDDNSERWVVRLHAARQAYNDNKTTSKDTETVMKVRSKNLTPTLTDSLEELVLDKSLRSWNRLTFPDATAVPSFYLEPKLKRLEPYTGHTEKPVENAFFSTEAGGRSHAEYQQVFYPGGYQVVLHERSKGEAGIGHNLPRLFYVLGRCTYSSSDRKEFSIMMSRRPDDKAPWPTDLAVMSCPRCSKAPKTSGSSGQEYVLARQPLMTQAENIGIAIRFVPRLFCTSCYEATLEGQHLTLPQGWVRTRQDAAGAEVREAYCHMPASDPLFVAPQPGDPCYQVDAAMATGVGPAVPAWKLDSQIMFNGHNESLGTAYLTEVVSPMGGKVKRKDNAAFATKKDGVPFGKMGIMSVSDDPLARNPSFGVLARCSNTGCDWRWQMESNSVHLKRCAGCECAAYCSAACQKAHWQQHKAHCKRVVKA
mmetsp:Transcript_2106/g.3596  ORF Transcript_2106/g.3596 Transcript_2106/m.3596 type:complete len:453 (-) Transcript_2106:621-1979(-)|eukprot:CAMPEP_0198199456 /NCGR_PEP_ID=MMETSP1445-20131203/2754_1 /TAXON_ID=36898 /ORGANISM="Pyramimonas sp., Strain CCMP2087" /LENGTH=452 /DNA_ID=CAMNT_0043869311 /DNA_START=331 /DNA_END=1689 /DNA_ORIENTATION=+